MPLSLTVVLVSVTFNTLKTLIPVCWRTYAAEHDQTLSNICGSYVLCKLFSCVLYLVRGVAQ